ncbi:helix-turn-helix domain-containing GNAT family N-acetyltransferase [Herbaspirillum lusitanum]|uniref:Helix-turn-helix domain-containing GNAT family N-acetyltransferase n=1 Tax=Herbaspirillum lusitanum TaxID=213312 RepID=A0ABW9AHA2_9BURK
MSDHDPLLIDQVRSASRQMVRELGFMQTTLAATDYSPSAVHSIVEIAASKGMTSAQLAEILQLEKSSISRMVRKLVEAGELRETVSNDDARSKLLTLTAKGRRTLAAINRFGRMQVTTALAQLSEREQQLVCQGLTAYSRALEAHRLGQARTPAHGIEIHQGYLPGAIGRVVEMHARFYSRSVGFGQFFESLVASGISEFASRLHNPRNGMWVAVDADRVVGSVVIDGEDLGNDTAHLRWFIVDDGMRGSGVGRKLLAEALAFCDREGFASTRLWTFKGLDAARQLYEHAGFKLIEECPGQQWGSEVIEQCFIRERTAR